MDPIVAKAAKGIITDGAQPDEYGNAIPLKAYMLHVNNHIYDLRDPDAVIDAHDRILDYQNKLANGTMKTYEGHSTEYGEGGRARLAYDAKRVGLAAGYHAGRHNLSWQSMHAEAMDDVQWGARIAKAQGKF